MDLLIYIVISLAAGALFGYLWAARRSSNQVAQLREANIGLQKDLELEKRVLEERLKAMDEAQDQLTHTFKSLSAEALNKNTEQFMKLAENNLRHLHELSKNELDKKEKAVENLVKPLHEAMQKTHEQMHKIELERQQAYGALSKHLSSMAETQKILQDETRNLVNALRRPEVRGRWGEMSLKRLAELAGMVQHCDFEEQASTQTENGLQRPDMLVHMPDGRDIVVDAKTPLDAYLSALESKDDQERQGHLTRHVQNIRNHVRSLSGKAYWEQFPKAPDFVVMFIPGEQFLSAALDVDRNLMEEAMQHKVILATPTSFVALLRAVAYGWRQEQLAENAELIRKVGEELYGRLQTFAEHFNKIGKSLNNGVTAYNQAVGSFESRVLPSARKFNEMGLEANKELSGPEAVERIARQSSEGE